MDAKSTFGKKRAAKSARLSRPVWRIVLRPTASVSGFVCVTAFGAEGGRISKRYPAISVLGATQLISLVFGFGLILGMVSRQLNYLAQVLLP